jgi:hypothetical protein
MSHSSSAVESDRDFVDRLSLKPFDAWMRDDLMRLHTIAMRVTQDDPRTESEMEHKNTKPVDRDPAPKLDASNGSAVRAGERPAPYIPSAEEHMTPRWRVKARGDDLITYWKSKPRGSNEYAAAEIIEELERELAIQTRERAALAEHYREHQCVLSSEEEKVRRLLAIMECDTLDDAILQAEFDVKESIAAALAIKKAAGHPEQVWPSPHERRFFIALKESMQSASESTGDWQCMEYADGWITFPNRQSAEKYQEETGALMRYRRHYPAKSPADSGSDR